VKKLLAQLMKNSTWIFESPSSLPPKLKQPNKLFEFVRLFKS
jgi:hypothetical protein